MRIIIEEFSSKVVNVLATIGYPGIFLAMMIEGMSIPFPGMIVILFAGFAVWQGALDFWPAVVLATMGYTIGSFAPYFLGLKGRELFSGKLGGFSLGSKFFSSFIKKHFNNYDYLFVCFSRPFLVGNYVSYVAGIARMDLVRYFFSTAVGSSIKCTVMIFLGFILGVKWFVILDMLPIYSAASTAVIICGILIIVFRKNIASGLKDLLINYRVLTGCFDVFKR